MDELHNLMFHVDYVSPSSASSSNCKSVKSPLFTLFIKGFKNLEACLDAYFLTPSSPLKSPNSPTSSPKTFATGAKRVIRHLPPVLIWSLKRGETEQQDRFDFPRTLNMAKYIHPNGNPADIDDLNSSDHHYSLYSVIVEYESPAIRYFAFGRPDLEADSGQWYKFADDLHAVPQSTVFDSSVGGQEWLCVNYLYIICLSSDNLLFD